MVTFSDLGFVCNFGLSDDLGSLVDNDPWQLMYVLRKRFSLFDLQLYREGKLYSNC